MDYEQEQLAIATHIIARELDEVLQSLPERMGFALVLFELNDEGRTSVMANVPDEVAVYVLEGALEQAKLEMKRRAN